MKQTVLRFGGPSRQAGSLAREKVNGRRQRRRTGRQLLNYTLIFVIAAAIMAILSLTVLFQIETITVTGTNKYVSQEIIDASGVKPGDNLFRVSVKSIKKRLSGFAYVEDVKLNRQFPATLEIEIVQEKPLGAVSTSVGYVIIGRSGKVLELGAQSLPEDMMVVSGMYLYDPKVGQILGEGYPSDKQEEAKREKEGFIMLTRLVDAVSSTEFNQMTLVDFSDRLNMLIVYDNRVMIELGTEADLDYKLKFLKRIISEELDSNFEGILDASLASSSREVWKTPCNIQQRLEERQISIQQAQAEDDPEESNEPSAFTSGNPDFAVVPDSNSSSSQAPLVDPDNPDTQSSSSSDVSSSSQPSSGAGGSSSSQVSSSSTQSVPPGQINPDDFAVVRPSSSSGEGKENSSSSQG